MHWDWTLTFAGIAAMTGILNWILGMMERRTTRAEKDRAEVRTWSMRVANIADRGLYAVLTYDDAKGPPLRVSTIGAVSPRGLKLRAFEPNGSYDPNFALGITRKQLMVDRDIGGSRVIGSDEIQFFLVVPKRPFWSRHARTRARISLRFEERSASRRRSSIMITSEEIPWMARSADKAT